MKRTLVFFALVLGFLPQQLRAQCPVDLDLFHLRHYSYKVTKFDVAMEILNHYHPHIGLSNVAVGVFDVGFYPNAQVQGEFLRDQYMCQGPLPERSTWDRLPIEDRARVEDCAHGTAMTGVMSAVDGDGGVGGYLALLQEPSKPDVARVYYTGLTEEEYRDYHFGFFGTGRRRASRTVRGIIRGLESLIDAGAQVISISMSQPLPTGDTRDLEQAREAWSELLQENEDVLFVMSAGNNNRRPYPEVFPQGFGGAANVLKIGGLQLDADDRPVRWERSNYGPGIDIYAPAHQVPIVFNNSYLLDDGTSISTPIVASLAAILKSIRPTMTAADIKRRIRETADRTSRTTPIVDFARAIIETLREVQHLPPLQRDMLNPSRSDMALYPSDLLARICHRGEVTSPANITFRYAGNVFASIGSRPGRTRYAFGSQILPRSWDTQSYAERAPGLIWQYSVNGPLEISPLSFGNEYMMYGTAAGNLPGASPGYTYMSVSGQVEGESCSYYEERGQSFNIIANAFSEGRRLLLQNGAINATVVSCLLERPDRVGLPEPSAIPMQAGHCEGLEEEAGGPGTPLSESLEGRFVNMPYFVFDEEFWAATQRGCRYFFDQ